MANRNFLVGITGGMGAGKSTVSDEIRSAGYPVLSADEITRFVTSPGTGGFSSVAALFGKAAVTAAGELDRAFIREVISRDPELRRKLENLIHPLVQQEAAKRAGDAFARGARAVFYEAPLLFEAKSDHRMDAVISVVADDGLRAERIARRDGVSEDSARRLMNAQLSQKEKIARSDWVIRNDGDRGGLSEQVRKVLREIEERIAARLSDSR